MDRLNIAPGLVHPSQAHLQTRHGCLSATTATKLAAISLRYGGCLSSMEIKCFRIGRSRSDCGRLEPLLGVFGLLPLF